MSREHFEQLLKEKFDNLIDYRVCSNGDGEYMAWDMQVAWFAWQAATKAMEAKCAALAAESSAMDERLKRLIQIINNADNSYCMCGEAMETHTHGGCGHPTGMFDYHYDRWLESGKETPATDAFLAEVRASAIDSLVDIKTKQLADMHPDTHAFGATSMSIRSQINELQVFADQLRKGVQS